MNHIVLGATLPFLIAAALYARARFRASLRLLVLAPVFMTLGGGWAVAPDIPRMLRLQGLYERLHQSPRIDIFLWHYSIDQVETDSPLYPVAFVLMGLCLFVAAWRELHLLERA